MPVDNRPLMAQFFSQEKIRAQRSAWFDQAPRGGSVDPDRVAGLMLGLAIGDSLGKTSESMSAADRRARHGEIRDYLPWDGRPVGMPSDDTQMAAWTLECLLEDDGLVPEHVATAFATGRIYGKGASVRAFLRNHSTHLPWHECGTESAGNGALMRIAPIVLPWLSEEPSPALWADALLCGMITHNDALSNSACVAFTHILSELLHAERPPQTSWWLDQWMAVAPAIEGDDTDYAPRSPSLQGMRGPAWRIVETLLRSGQRDRFDVRRASDTWYSGAYLLETVPCVLHILACHGHDPEEAILRAVNDARDNDTVAAIVGAAVGALHGASALPERWRRALLGRTRESDDGRVQELIEQATHRWLR